MPGEHWEGGLLIIWEQKKKVGREMKSYILLLGLLLLVSVGWSQTAGDAVRIRQNEFGFDARVLGMGGGGVALAGDYSAIYWNPAGLASLRTSRFSGEFSHLRFSNNALFAGSLNEMTSNSTRLRNAGLAIPLPTSRGSLVLAFGYNFVKDFDEYLYFSGFNRLSNGIRFELDDGTGNYQWYDFDRNVDQSEEVTVDGGLHQWSFGAGIALSPNFDLGATMNFWKGKDDYQLVFQQEDRQGFYQTFPADFHRYSVNQKILTDYKAFSLKIGGMFKLNPIARLGMAVEFPTTFTVTENYSMSDELEFDDGYVDAVEYEPGEWQYEVQTPFRFDAGLGLQTERLTLSASATYQDWSQTRFRIPDNAMLDSDYDELLSQNRVLQQDYRETIDYHIGGELLLPGKTVALRGGYAVYPSPLKDATSEQDRVYYSGGVGLRIDRNAWLDFAYQRGNYQRQSEDVYTPGGTEEDVTENRFFVGVRLSF